MPTTRATHLLRRTVALAAAPALVLTAAACGDDDDGGADAGSFCEQVEAPFGGLNDPNADPDETVAALSDIDPPGEIADEWDMLVTSLEDLQSLGEEEASEEVLERLSDPELQEAGESIEAYLTEECDL